MSVKGIDISSNNGQHLDFRKAYADGVRFVYIKVSEGIGYSNPYAKQHALAAKEAGMLVGAYAFVRPKEGRRGGQEAEYFIAQARKANLLDKGCLRPVADIEVTDLEEGKPSRRYHYDFLERMIKIIQPGTFTHADERPMIYTGSWFWDGVLKARNAHGCPLWLAAYTANWKKFIPAGFLRGVSIHQYTDQGTVNGIPGKVDLNRYLGRNVEKLKARHVMKKDA